MVTGRAETAPPALDTQPVTGDELWVIQLSRARVRRRVLEWTLRLLVAAVILVSWQIIGHQNPLFTSYPTAVAVAAWHEITSGVLISAIGESVEILALGLLLAVVVGVLAGLVIGRYALVASSVEWLVSALNSTPLLAVIPLIIVWFGLGIESKVFTVFSLTVFSMIFNTAAGVQEVERNILDVGRAFKASEGQVFRKIILPSSVPFIMTGLRISIGRALIGTVAAEFFTGIGGLGGLIQKYSASYQTDYMLVPVLTLMLLGVILTAVARWLENIVAPWRERR
jgi:ABC-type nitrate/sulfonate/bicarbonate transport system permease component